MRNVSAFQPNTASGTTKAYYPLNGNSRDYSGNTNTGTDTAITYPQGRFGQGAKFNGSSSFVSLGTSSTLNPSPNITVSCWVNRANTNDHTFISRDTLVSVGTDRCYSLRAYSNNIYFEVFGSSTTSFAGGTTYIRPGTWYHLLGTYDGTTIKTYVNGKQEGNVAFSATLFQATVNTVLGKIGASTQYTNGLIDEVIIESRAWTAKEVETYYRKSVQNYRPKNMAQMIISFLISEVATLTETVSTLRQRVFSVSETTTLTESWTTALGKIFSIVESVNLSETFTSARTFVFNVAETVGLTELTASVYRKWENITKNISSWTDKSKNSSTWTDKSKNSSNWTNKPKV